MKKLRYTNGAMKRLHKDHGIDLMSGQSFAASLNGAGFAPWIQVYWAGRLHETPDLTFDQAEAETDELEPGEIMEGVNEAIRRAFRLEGPAAATPDEAPEPKRLEVVP
jgi:hypothetical protein